MENLSTMLRDNTTSVVITLATNISVDLWTDFNQNESFPDLPLPLDMQFNDGHFMAIIMYSVLMMFSAVGNIYVVCSIMRLRRRNGKLGRINLLLIHLTIADLVVTLIMMPMEIAWSATVSWRAGDLLCRIFSFFRVLGLYLSGFVLICICLDRHYAVMTPLAVFDAEDRVKRLLVVAWTVAIVCSLPQCYIFHVATHPYFTWYEQCVTFHSFPSVEYELAYSMFGFCLMYALPMSTILYCYACIFRKMRRIGLENGNETVLRRSDSTFIQRAKMKTLKMTVITALVFCICWTPYNVISLWFWIDRSSAMKLDQRVQKALFVFACTNSCFNPLIYGWYHLSGRPAINSGVRTSRVPRVALV